MANIINNVEALKGLYVALGGDIADVENISTSAEMLYAMQDVAAAAATELPVVKKADEGMVLIVNSSGKWAKGDIPTELPAVTSEDEGDVLGVNSSGEWVKVPLNNSYKYVRISPRNGLSLTITPSGDEDDPYDLYELSYTGYTASADGVTVHDEIATGISVDYNTVVQIIDANQEFNFITPVMQKITNFRLNGMGVYFSTVPFAMHIEPISSYGISEPVNGIAFISEMTASKLTFKVYKF